MKTFVLACLLASSLFAIQNVTIGVLAFRTKAETLKEWEPTARYLTQKEPEYRFRILPLTYPELNHAVKNSTIDFVVTNSGHYVYLEKKYHISRIATMMRYVEGRWIDRFGGVVFTRASRDEIQTLADLRGKKIAAVDAESLGGYVAQMVELSHHGVDTKNAQLSFTGMPHTTTIKAVLEGRADAGFVRTDVLEKMVQSGALDASELKVLNAQKVPGFPYYLSTKLYPEWPIAQLRHTPKDLCNEVLIALLDTLPHKIPKEKTIGWAAPMEYSDVHNAFKLLRLPPYDKADPFTLSDIYERYREFIWLVGVFMGLILIGVIREIALRRKLMFENRKNELFLTQSSDGIHILNAAGDIVQVSDLFCKMLGYTREEMMGMNVKQWDLMVPLESIQEHIQTINDECQVVRSKHRRKDGTTYDAEIHVSLIALNEKRLVYCKAQDISRQLLEETRTKLATLVYEHSSDAIVITDQYSRIISVNPSFTQMSGYTIEQIQGSSSNVLKSGHHSAEFYRQLWEAIETNGEWSGEIIDRHHDGPIFSKWLTIKSIYDNEGNAYRRIAIFSDITDQKETKYQLWYHANFDTLTTLSNRSMFLYRLEKEIGDLERHRIPLVLIYLDLDNFKEINDTLGHDKGDMLLQEVAKRLLQCVRRNDVVSRLGGDEFTIILPKIESEVIVDTIASKIILELSRPFHIGGESLFISASMGITVGPNDGESAEVLLKNADQAMYAAKNQGRNRFCYFTPSMQEILNQRSLMIYELRSAIEAKEFVVFYQPILELSSGDVYKAEALVRWSLLESLYRLRKRRDRSWRSEVSFFKKRLNK